MVGAGRFELYQAKITEPLKTKDIQQYQWLRWLFAFSLRCGKMQQSLFWVIEKDRRKLGGCAIHFVLSIAGAPSVGNVIIISRSDSAVVRLATTEFKQRCQGV
jgi:hypothetical protein